MNLQEFSDTWIDVTVKDEPYTHMKDYVKELMDTLIKQKHSGASFSLILHYFNSLIEDYNKYCGVK